MKLFLFALSTVFSVNAFAFNSCENFAAKYSVDAVTTQLVLDGTSVFANNIFPSEPLLQEIVVSDAGYIEKYETVITVSPKDESTAATRYYVTLAVEDHGASCFLIEGSSQIELEN